MPTAPDPTVSDVPLPSRAPTRLWRPIVLVALIAGLGWGARFVPGLRHWIETAQSGQLPVAWLLAGGVLYCALGLPRQALSLACGLTCGTGLGMAVVTAATVTGSAIAYGVASAFIGPGLRDRNAGSGTRRSVIGPRDTHHPQNGDAASHPPRGQPDSSGRDRPDNRTSADRTGNDERSDGTATGPFATARLTALRTRLAGQPFRAVLVCRLMPVGSALLVNLAAGAYRIGFWPFLAATLIGSAPQSLLFVLLGAGTRIGQQGQFALAGALAALSIGLGIALMRRAPDRV